MNASYPYRRKKPRSGVHPGAPAGPAPRADTAPGPRSAGWAPRGPGPIAAQPHASALRVRNFRLLLSTVGEEALGLRLGVSLARLRELEQGLNFGDETAHHLEFMLGLRSGFIDLVNPQLTAIDVERLKSAPENDFVETDAMVDRVSDPEPVARSTGPEVPVSVAARTVPAALTVSGGSPPRMTAPSSAPAALPVRVLPSSAGPPVSTDVPPQVADTIASSSSGSSPAMAQSSSRPAKAPDTAPRTQKARRNATPEPQPATQAETPVKKRAARSVPKPPIEPASEPAPPQSTATAAPRTSASSRKKSGIAPRAAASGLAPGANETPASTRVTANLRALAPAARSTPAAESAPSAPPPAQPSPVSPASHIPTPSTGPVTGSVRMAGKKTPATAAVGPVDDEELRRRELRRANLALVSSRPGGKSQLGRLAGMSPANISHRLHGNTALDEESAAFFCERLELPEGWLDAPHTEDEVPAHVWGLLAQHAAAPAHANPSRPKQTIEAKRRRMPNEAPRAPADIPALAQSGPTLALAERVGSAPRSTAPEPLREAAGVALGTAAASSRPTPPAFGSGAPARGESSVTESVENPNPELAPIAEALLKTLALKARQGRLTEEQALKLLTEVSLM